MVLLAVILSSNWNRKECKQWNVSAEQERQWWHDRCSAGEFSSSSSLSDRCTAFAMHNVHIFPSADKEQEAIAVIGHCGIRDSTESLLRFVAVSIHWWKGKSEEPSEALKHEMHNKLSTKFNFPSEPPQCQFVYATSFHVYGFARTKQIAVPLRCACFVLLCSADGQITLNALPNQFADR